MIYQLKKLIVLFLLLFLCLAVYGQQDSRYDAGLNLPFNEKAGDVNPQTGNLTLSFTDLSLPGRAGMNFQFGRIWSLNQSNVFTMSRNPVDGSNTLSSRTIEQTHHMGVGWTSTLPYIMEDTSSGEMVKSLFYGGGVYELDQSGLGNYNPEKSNILGYDLLDLRVYESAGIGYEEFTLYDMDDLAAGYPVSDRSTDRSAYQLLLKDNSCIWFRQDGHIMMQSDRTGLNKIWYFYDDFSRLSLVVDTIGRKIEFRYNGDNNLSEIVWMVEKGVKNPDNTREFKEVTKSIAYSYKRADEYNETYRFLANNYVLDEKDPFVLETVTDPMGNVTRYDWEEGLVGFTYDSKKSHSENIYMLITSVTSMVTTAGDGIEQFLNRRFFEYEIPARGLYRKYFYGGYMEYYKISRQYYLNRHARMMNDTRYVYHDNNEAGNFNRYTTVIELGNTKTTYTYSLSSDKNRYHVLDTLTVETTDGFKQLNDYVYDNDRKKILDQVFRQGAFIYNEKYLYDAKGNLKRREDKMGLVTVAEYDPKYSIPLHTYKLFTNDGVEEQYESETIINEQGQVIEQLLLLKQKDGKKRTVTMEKLTYDDYGNVIAKTDAEGNTVHTVFDLTHHAFPVKIYTDVRIDSWSAGGTVHDNWQTDPDGTQQVRIRSWKVFNSDGTVWLEIDNEGYGIEHYYDNNNIEVETVNPDENDMKSFALPIELINGNPTTTDFDDFMENPDLELFLHSRMDNPGARMTIDYGREFIKTFADMDLGNGYVKVSGVQKDGLGNVEKEIEYDETGDEYAVKEMTYDDLGRMVALTDPDRGSAYTLVKVNGTEVRRYDKTWIVKYDDAGRKIMVLYPETGEGRTDTKTITYNDVENSVTTQDPGGRRVYERRDWNGNVVKVIGYGDANTPVQDVQEYSYTYDPLNRKTSFTDARGIVTRYVYDERNLLVEQNYGDGSDFMEYDDRGQLVKKSDRKGQLITFTYDAMGRNTCAYHYTSKKAFAEGTLHHKVALSYDNRGNAVRISNSNLTEHYIYDYGNRVINLERTLKDHALRTQLISVWGGTAEDQVFSFRYVYNDGGMVKKMIYPDGGVHTFDYDPYLGRLREIGEGADETIVVPFVTDLTYNKSGVVTRMNYANSTFQEWEFDNRKLIKDISITGGMDTIENLHYTLNGSGDILSINDNEYSYDGFDRITGAKTLVPGNVDRKKIVAEHFGTYENGSQDTAVIYDADADIFPEDTPDGRINGEDYILAVLTTSEDTYDVESFAYDKNGNRTRLVQNGDEYTYEYGPRNCLERIRVKKQDSDTRALFAEYFYDLNGNTIRRVIHTDDEEKEIEFEYDTMNRLVKTKENETNLTEYFYDNAGNRFIKKNNEGTTVYLRHGQIAVAMDIELPAESAEVTGKVNRYVLSGDLLAGRITKTYKQDDTVETTKYWYHLDHLNSTKAVTKEDGTVDVQYEYRAFGEQLKKLGQGDARYTYGGKELDGETNLYYFNARYYDATIGRFINVDPVQDGTNWYVYCGNNPLAKVDPTGLWEHSPIQKPEISTQFYEKPIRLAIIMNRYGKRTRGNRNDRSHGGGDLRANIGEPIFAVQDGTIAAITRNDTSNRGFGNSVILKIKYRYPSAEMVQDIRNKNFANMKIKLRYHGKNLFVRYAHLSNVALALRIGATVHSGQELGATGNSGNAPKDKPSQDHLHLTVSTSLFGGGVGNSKIHTRSNDYINPEPFFDNLNLNPKDNSNRDIFTENILKENHYPQN